MAYASPTANSASPDDAPTTALQNAAALMLLLDGPEAQAVMAQLSLHEASQLRQALAAVDPGHLLVTGKATPIAGNSTVAAQMGSGIGAVGAVGAREAPTYSRLLTESSHYVRGLLRQAFATAQGAQASAWPANGAGGQSYSPRTARFDTPETGMERLRRADLATAAQVLAAEHPQAAAVALSMLGTDFAARLLQMLPPRLRADLTLRLATLGPIGPEALQLLQDGLLEAVQLREARRQGPQGGVHQAAQILNRLGTPMESAVLEALRVQNPDIAVRLAERLVPAPTTQMGAPA